MKTNKIIEGNKIIAEFMGWEVSEKAKSLKKRGLTINTIPYGYFKIHPDDLLYQSSWDWLMPVVEKIEKESFNIFGEYEDVIINGCSCFVETRDREISIIETTKIEATYKAVVEFVKWYNKQKKDETK